MFSSFQEKTYQTIDALFSGKKKGDKTDEQKESNNKMGDLEAERVVGEYPAVVKNSIEIKCQGKKYAYHLGEVLNRKWSSESFQTPPTPKPKDRYGMKKGGGDRFGMDAQHGGKEIQLRICLFTINTDAIVPFLEFWLVPNTENVLSFPETVFQVNVMVEGEEGEEEHAAFLDVCRKKMSELGIFTTEEEEAFTTERMERDYHGFISAPPGDGVGQEDIVYVFYQLRPPIGAGNGTTAILDEMLNRHKVLETPVDAKLRSLFYTYPELLYIYGSPVSPIDSFVYGEDSTYDVSDEAPQEIPYCLYLCQDKTEFSQDFQEGKAVETITGNILRGIEEPHYVSPKDKYKIAASTADDSEKLNRTEDEHGYFYYFTNELMGGEDVKVVKRYAVFVYNTDYRLDKDTLDALKSADLEKRLVGGSFWKWNFKLSDWMKGGAQYLQFYYNPVAAKSLKKGDMIVKKEFTEIITAKKRGSNVSSSSSSSDSSSESDVSEKRQTIDINPDPESEEGEVENIPEPESENPEDKEEVENIPEPEPENPEDKEEVENIPEPEPENPESENPEDKEEVENIPEPESENPEPENPEDKEEVENIPEPEPENPEPENPEDKEEIENIPEPEPENPEPESEETENIQEEEKENIDYASVYFQRDDVPLWCIKHRICFTCLDSDSDSEPITETDK